MEKTRLCRWCYETKEIIEFKRTDRSKELGHFFAHECRDCRNRRGKIHYDKHYSAKATHPEGYVKQNNYLVNQNKLPETLQINKARQEILDALMVGQIIKLKQSKRDKYTWSKGVIKSKNTNFISVDVGKTYLETLPITELQNIEL